MLNPIQAGRNAARFVDMLESALVGEWGQPDSFRWVPSEDKGVHIARLQATLMRLHQVLVRWEEAAAGDSITVNRPTAEPTIEQRLRWAAAAIAAHDRASSAAESGMVTDLLAGVLHTLAREGDSAADTIAAAVELFTQIGGAEDGRPWGTAEDHFVEFSAMLTATLLDRAEELTESGALGVLKNALNATRSSRP